MPDRTKSPTLSLKHKSTRHERQDEKKSDEDEMFLLDEDVGQENVKTSPSGEVCSDHLSQCSLANDIYREMLPTRVRIHTETRKKTWL